MNKSWWKEAVVYQVYPRSFMDSNGDGIGDLDGIRSKLNYLQQLGIDVIWLSPVYQSPNDDNGYDISDYRSIMDEFGTMGDFDALLEEAHQRGIKIVMDLVVNHTSDEHPWFLASKSSKDSPCRDYYIWRKAPNGWTSVFSGSAWEFDPTTEEYYLHLFSKKQPDLNWENPQVRGDVYDLMKFWLDKGVDGFRMDVINFISKEIHETGGEFVNGPRVHEFLQEMNREVLSKYDVMTVGETPGVTPEQAAMYTGEHRNELNMVFQFEHMDLDSGPGGKWNVQPWRLEDLKRVMSKWQVELHGIGWNSLYLNNHDQPRMVSRFGNDQEYRVLSAKMLATFLHMQAGTPFIYQGEEIGMTNVKFDSIDAYQDVETHNMWKEKVVQGGANPDDVLSAIHAKGRDNARTPMQWSAEKHGGFTTGSPWLPVNPNYVDVNAEQALQDPDSTFHYYRKLIQLRKQHPIIVYGNYRLVSDTHEDVYAYIREYSNGETSGQASEQLLVVLNFFAGTPEFVVPCEFADKSRELLISNYPVNEATPADKFVLRPYEARVYLLK